jgi:UbiA prenyltransferase family
MVDRVWPILRGMSSTEPLASRERRRSLVHTTPVLLLRAAHPRQALLTAGGLAIAAAITGRPGREVALVLATVLVGQAVLGWHNDLVDRQRDETRLPSGKPIADGYLDPGTTWFALICGVLLLVPLSIQNGVTAGAAYLVSVALGLVGNVALRRGWLSWVTWAASYALYPYFLSYGGWGGDATGDPPQVVMVVLAALLGVGVHVLCALPGLVADHEDGIRHLPLRIALRLGATRLLVLALAWTLLDLVAMLVVGNSVGLAR